MTSASSTETVEPLGQAQGRFVGIAKIDPARVSPFLMRCLFTMFAEDVELIPLGSFTELLNSLRGEVHHGSDMVRGLWESMDKVMHAVDAPSNKAKSKANI